MKKEILTMEKIKNDLGILNKENKVHIALYVLGLVLFAGLFVIDVARLRRLYLVSITCLVFVLAVFVYRLIVRLEYKKMAKTGGFEVYTGGLSNKKISWFVNFMVGRRSFLLFRLNFSKYGSFWLSEWYRKNWEEIYMGITANGLYSSSEPGDLFYLVCNKRGKVLIAYPAKLFEFPEIDG